MSKIMRYLSAFMVLSSAVQALPVDNQPSTPEPVPSWYSALANIPGRQPGTPEIVGGYEVNPKFRYPFIVSLQRNNRHFCGGAMIGENLVMTAAHCSTGYGKPGATKELLVTAHRHDLRKSADSEQGCNYNVTQVVMNPAWSFWTNRNDVAIWKLSALPCAHKIDFASPVLDDGSHSPDGTNLTAIGWGVTYSGSSTVSPILLEVKVPIVPFKSCNASYPNKIDDSMVCAGYPQGGKDTCQGDSGSPVFVYNEKGQPIIVGVTSWGRGCASAGYPGVYARVSNLKSWIFETIAKLSTGTPIPQPPEDEVTKDEVQAGFWSRY